ncbi:DNA alkylation repair protein [Clostridium gasigenes]|nr:DNA alkylation repair protein [Clostridium gasigenes]
MENLKMSSEMTFDEVFSLLEAWGTEARRKTNAKKNAGDNQFGVAIGNLRVLAIKLKINHILAMELWKSGNVDARILSTMIIDKDELSANEIMEMIDGLTYSVLVDEFVYNVIAKTIYADELYNELVDSDDECRGRAAWDIIIAKVISENTIDRAIDLDLDSIIKKIENEMKDAPRCKQESMNRCLCEIGIHFSEYTQKCIEVGESLGKLDKRQVPKGGTSTYAPEWITRGIKALYKKNSK